MSKGVDYLTRPEHSEAFRRRQLIWHHNALLGSVRLAQTTMASILRAETTTPAAQALASDINIQLEALAKALADRKGP